MLAYWIHACVQQYVENIVCLNVYEWKLDYEQASITRMSKWTYDHAGEVVYVIKTVIILIRAHLITRQRFDAVRASAVKFYDV
jgi:hypothetical protein